MAYWDKGWRERWWNELNADPDFDVIVIGGGITGAGIVHEAARAGLRTLLLEQKDFAEGTSSRSSKLVHGGLRYLAQYKFGLTNDSVKGREQLLRDAPGLVEPQRFVIPNYNTHGLSRRDLKAGLAIYDMMACKRDYKKHSVADTTLLAPHIDQYGLIGGLSYTDAKTDDARLVMRLIQEAVGEGALAFNYTEAKQLLTTDKITDDGAEKVVTGIVIEDSVTGFVSQVNAKAVINATGVHADRLREQVGHAAKMRPVRGSHLIFPANVFPVAQAVSFIDPVEPKRPMFAYPWQGVTILGTTDLDHEGDLNLEPKITAEEVKLLMAGAQLQFPFLSLSLDDIVSSYAGVRPLVDNGAGESFEESRNHEVWVEDGLITVTGGKLTTFRLTAVEALQTAAKQLDKPLKLKASAPIFDKALSPSSSLPATVVQRLVGRYGLKATDLLGDMPAEELIAVGGTEVLWAELRWALRHEAVECIADLMLRRTRLGLLLKGGGEAYHDKLRHLFIDELAWTEARWNKEWQQYCQRWQQHYSLPSEDEIGDWQTLAEEARQARRSQ